jgi:hypothetical protein
MNSAGFLATVFTNLLEPLRSAGTECPGFSITDVMMPQLNGIDLEVQLKAIYPRCRTWHEIRRARRINLTSCQIMHPIASACFNFEPPRWLNRRGVGRITYESIRSTNASRKSSARRRSSGKKRADGCCQSVCGGNHARSEQSPRSNNKSRLLD